MVRNDPIDMTTIENQQSDRLELCSFDACGKNFRSPIIWGKN